MRKNLLCFILLLLPLAVFGQTHNEAGLPYIRNYPPKEYGAYPENWAIVQDHRGVMYFGNGNDFGNGNGVLEYDGVSWRLIPLPNKTTVRSFAIDETGRIYVGAVGDFGYLEPDSIGQMHFISLLDDVDKRNREFGDVWETFTTNRNVYFNANSLFQFAAPVESSHRLKIWNPEPKFHASYVVHDRFYIRQWEVGLMRMERDSLRLVPGGEKFANERIYVMVPLDDKRILIGTRTQGLFIYDGNSFSPFKTEADDFLLANHLYCGTVLNDGTIALGTLVGGLAIIDKQGRYLLHIDKAAGLQNNSVLYLYQDLQGALWLALSNGITRIEISSPLSVFDARLGVETSVQSILRHDGTLYVASGYGGVYYLNSRQKAFRPVPGITTTESWRILSFDDRLLVASFAGVYEIRGNHATFVRESVSYDYRAVTLQRSRQDSNRIFVGLEKGLASLYLRNGKWIDEGKAVGIDENIQTIVENKDGQLWLGTNATGVLLVNYHEGFSLKSPEVRRFGAAENLPAGGVSVFSIDGKEYFGTNAGLFHFDKNTTSFLPDSTFPGITFTGSSGNCIFNEDHLGNVWLSYGTESAVAHRQTDGSYQVEKTPFLRFAGTRVNDIYPEDDSVVWFGGPDGLIRYDANVQKDYEADFATLLRRVIVNGDSVIFGGTTANHEEDGKKLIPALAYSNNALRFEYAAPSYDNESANEFQYFLEGFDSDPSGSKWSNETKRDYTNLPAGEYHFRVRAKNLYQHISSEAVYDFNILPPWYRTWWAYGGYVLLMGLLVLTANRIQHARLVMRERQSAELLSRIGKDITASLDSDTIFFKLYENVNQLIDATVFGVGIYHADQQQIEYRLAIEKGKKYEPYMRDTRDKNQFPVWCIENRRPVFINDVSREYHRYIKEYKDEHSRLEDGTISQDPQSLIYLPLIAKDNVLGIITVQSFRKNAYTGYHLHVLQNLAAYTTIAMDNANAYRQLNTLLANLERTVEERTAEIQKQKENVELLSEVGKEITASLDMDTIFFKLYEHVNQLADASIFGVGIYHPEMEQIEYRLAIEKGKRYTPYTRDTSNKNQFPVWCIENRRPVFINDVSAEYSNYISHYEEPKEVVLEDGTAYEKAHSMIYLPLIAQNRALGVITIQSFQKHAYTTYHLSILQNLAAYTTVALYNARLFEEIQQARAAAEEANEAKSSFLSTVSHELRTPLTSVLGFAKIIKKRLEEKIFPLVETDDVRTKRTIEQVAENLNVVVSEGERLTTLINNVLDLAKIEAGKIEWHEEKIEVVDLIERAIAATSSLFESSGLKCRKEIAADLPEIIGDRDKLIQVVINLISNAVKFTDKGSVTCRASQQGCEIVVSIIDTGMGIAPEDQPKVFEKFKQVGETLTNKPKGTGLGLTICKEIVEHHGGRIGVESPAFPLESSRDGGGKGSTFSFTLPTKPKAEAGLPQMDLAALLAQLKQRMQTTSMKPKNGKPSILVVDDEAAIRELLNQELHDAGYEVRVAENGRAALDQIRHGHPDLVILDVMMPEMNGFDVAAVLKNDPATMDIPILILSIVQDKERGYRLGVDRYLTKPIDTEALLREVGALLEQGKSHRKVMIVDEDASTVKTLSEVLQAGGYQVVETNGLELVKKAVSEKPDIIILNSMFSEKREVIKTLRFEKDLENVLFLVYE